MNKSLTHRQSLFLTEYILSGNATDAALRSGYSKKTAYSQGQRLLNNVEIEKELLKFRNNMQKRTEVTIEMVVNELRKIAFADIKNVYNENNSIKRVSELDEGTSAAVSEISEDHREGSTTRKVKMHSKLTALDSLMKHLGGYVNEMSIISKLNDEDLESLAQKLIKKFNNEETI